MRTSLFAALLIAAGALGCAREETVKTTETIETPEGTTTITTEKTVESTGDNPPVGPQGEVVPPEDDDRDGL